MMQKEKTAFLSVKVTIISTVIRHATYLRECLKYADWLVTHKGVSKRVSIGDTAQYAVEYLKTQLDDEKSIYTVKMRRSALGMLYGQQIQIELPVRDNTNITRSRHAVNADSHFAINGKYKDLFTIAMSTGGRRSDLLKLRPCDFVEINGNFYVKFEQSKGGRNRISPVLNADSVKEILAKFREDERVFKTINKNIDIHSSRREYARSLYRAILGDKELCVEYLRQYPKRHEYKTRKNNGGVSVTTEIKGDIYRDKSGNTYLRDDVYIVSQALGHNRLDVTVTHYLK